MIWPCSPYGLPPAAANDLDNGATRQRATTTKRTTVGLHCWPALEATATKAVEYAAQAIDAPSVRGDARSRFQSNRPGGRAGGAGEVCDDLL